MSSASDRALQRTAAEYDQTPYRSFPYPLTRPAHVAAVAHVFGLATPPVATARVLEIGCGGGGNLIPIAAAFPEARLVGLDLSPLQIGQARERAAAAGLGNVTFRTASVTDVDASWGSFDYIVCHGVYSWVPAEVRRAILRVIAERLSDTGAAVVSYNVLPGWHLRQVAREAMLAHAAEFADPAEKLAQARAFLDFLKDHVPSDTPYGAVVRREAAILAMQADDYVLHEFLEADNNPCTLLEFVAEAETAGLGYLGDSEIHSMQPERSGAEVAAQLRQISPTPVQLEQYLDLVAGRTFRQSILMKPAMVARADRAPSSACMAALHVAATFVDLPAPDSPGPFVFKSRARRSADAFRTLTTTSPVVARALTELARRWPATVTAAGLTDAVVADDASREAVHTAVLETLFRLLTSGMLLLSTEPIRAATADASHPLAWPLARADARLGAQQTTSLHHESVRLDGPARALLPLLDGSRDRPALTQALLDSADLESTLRALAAAALLSRQGVPAATV